MWGVKEIEKFLKVIRNFGGWKDFLGGKSHGKCNLRNFPWQSKKALHFLRGDGRPWH